MADKFKTGKLCILQNKKQQPTDSNMYNFYFSDYMTIVIRNDNEEIIVLPPFMSREAYKDNFNLTSYSTGKLALSADTLKSFLLEKRFFILTHTDGLYFDSSFNQKTHTIKIPLKEQTKYDTIDANARFYEMEPKEHKNITIKPSTTLQELVRQLPELHKNIKQAMEKVDNEIKLETEEKDIQCCNCGSCLGLTKLKFWGNKEKIE